MTREIIAGNSRFVKKLFCLTDSNEEEDTPLSHVKKFAFFLHDEGSHVKKFAFFLHDKGSHVKKFAFFLHEKAFYA